VLLKAAINGGRARDEHPALPLLPDELATSAAAALQAGAGAVHFHVRAADGRESLAPADLETALGAIRRSCGASPIGISTWAWIVPDPTERLAAVRGWRCGPDFASVNFDEAGAVELARLLLERGIGVEAGLASPDAARALARSGLGNACLRLLLEPPEPEPIAALQTVTEIETVLVAAELTGPRLLHGAGPTAWPLLTAARRRGYDARIGLEDTLTLPDGRLARHNAELVTAAVAVLRGPRSDPEIRLVTLDEPLLTALCTDPDACAAREGLSLGPHAELVKGAAARTLAFLRATGAPTPWGSYLAVDPLLRLAVGLCAFKGAPDAARAVELAYFTFPAWEGRGYATAMAEVLRALAAASGQVSIVRAHTLPVPNASGHILQTLGFRRVGEVLDPEDGLVWRWDWRVPARPAPRSAK
jgi:uncharacterized protein (DUF849 family)